MTHDIAIGPELPYVEKSFEHDSSEQRDFALAVMSRPTCGFEINDGNRDDPSYAYCGFVPNHAGDHGDWVS